jgi:hypothetical protein
METANELILAIREGTDAAFEEFKEGSADFLEKLIDYVHLRCDAKGLTGRRRTAVIYLDGVLRGIMIQMVARKKAAEREAFKLGIDVKTGLPLGQKES